jgi:hypothetical protein
MRKKFNVTGVMIPDRHFMVDISRKIAQMIEMVEAEDYFVINRPRQYGKTTALLLLKTALNRRDDYLAIQISFEGIGDESFQSEKQFVQSFCQVVRQCLILLGDKTLAEYLGEQLPKFSYMMELSQSITHLCSLTPKKIVLLIDEVDKSSNYEMVISFLGMLREKYLARNQGETKTFQSVILAGVHDIKSLKLKLRPETKAEYGSPWNIAAKFEIELGFSWQEIATMLQDYVHEMHVELEVAQMAQRIQEYTAGYPFLVSSLCKLMDEKILPAKEEKRLTLADCDQAAELLLEDENTNFESLIKNLENNPDLYLLVEKILLEGERVPFVFANSVICMGARYGVLREENRCCVIHNRIYQELIYNYLESNILLENFRRGVSSYNIRESFVDEENHLDMKSVLLKFQEFMKDNYAGRDQRFLEREGRLLFLAFLKPIINGYGYSFKEPVTSEEKRLDVVVTFLEQKYAVELKIWRGDKAHQRGIRQLAEYLDKQNLLQGYLLIYDFRQEKSYREEEILAHGKKIFVVWV